MSEANAAPNLVGLMFWKKVEALAIAVVFCLMMGVSIHRLLVFPGRTSLPSGILDPRDASTLARSTPTVLTSAQQPAATHTSGQSRGDLEGDAFGDDLVILYHAPAINRAGPAEKGTTIGTEQSARLSRKDTILETGMRIATRQEAGMLAESVVQYGDDVTMWSSERSKKSVLNRETR
jgi:hypothetical protein